MNTENQEKLINVTNNETNPQSGALTDLPVADGEANQIEAGSAPNGRLFLGTQVGVFVP